MIYKPGNYRDERSFLLKLNNPEDEHLRRSKMRLRNTGLERFVLIVCIILTPVFVIRGWALAASAVAIAAIVIAVVGFCRGELWDGKGGKSC
jgi:hypothetical protein